MAAILSPKSPLGELTHLSICNLSLNAVAIIGNSPKLSGLRVLELYNCAINDRRLSHMNLGRLAELELLLLPRNNIRLENLHVDEDNFLPKLARLVIDSTAEPRRRVVEQLSGPKMAECTVEVESVERTVTRRVREDFEDIRFKINYIEEHNNRVARGRGGYVPHISNFERVERTSRGNLSDFLTSDVLSHKSNRDKDRESGDRAR